MFSFVFFEIAFDEIIVDVITINLLAPQIKISELDNKKGIFSHCLLVLSVLYLISIMITQIFQQVFWFYFVFHKISRIFG